MAVLFRIKENSLIMFSLCILFVSFLVFPVSSVLAADSSQAEHISRMAMSTASMWMMERHVHEIEEGLEKGDLHEALEEAEELVPWIEGTPWLHELMPGSKKAAEAAKKVAAKLKAKDKKGAEAAFMEMKMQFGHFHHKLMEIVSGKKHSGGMH